MALVVPDTAEVFLLQRVTSSNYLLRLYSNDIVPAHDHTSANYTEVQGAGYAAIQLESFNWTHWEGSPSYAEYNDYVEFIFTEMTDPPSVVIGYYVTTASGQLLWAERFPTINFMPISGSTIKVRPRLTLGSESND